MSVKDDKGLRKKQAIYSEIYEKLPMDLDPLSWDATDRRRRYYVEWGMDLLEQHDLADTVAQKIGQATIRRYRQSGQCPEWVAESIQHLAEHGEWRPVPAPFECSPMYLANQLQDVDADKPVITIRN